MLPGRGSAAGGGILALPCFSHRRLCASIGDYRRVIFFGSALLHTRSVCISLSAFSLCLLSLCAVVLLCQVACITYVATCKSLSLYVQYC